MWHFDMNRTRTGLRSLLLSLETPNSVRSVALKRVVEYSSNAKALIRLRIRADRSEPLLVAHTTSLEISCCGSFNLIHFVLFNPSYDNICVV